MHEFCEHGLSKKSKSVVEPGQPICSRIDYYDDEELDVFAGRLPNTYTEEEVAQFREVWESLLPEDRLGWLSSIVKRGIMLPYLGPLD